MDVTLIVNGLDLSNRLSTYNVNRVITYRKVITTMDEVEHPYPGALRDTITFSLMPTTDEEGTEIYDALSPLVFDVVYSAQYASGRNITKRMRITSNLEHTFLLLSADGKRRYKGGQIRLREL